MGAESNQPDLIRVFVSEASDGTRVLGDALHTASKQIPPMLEVYEHYIVAHRLRGAAALDGFLLALKQGRHWARGLKPPVLG